jgi:cytochrome b
MLMLASLMVMVVAGLFSVDVDGLESGPLADYVSFDQGRIAAAVHHIMFNLLLALVALHVLAILFYLIGLRHDLITPMIHGRRRVDAQARIGDLGASAWKAAIGMLVAGACTYAIAQGFHL